MSEDKTIYTISEHSILIRFAEKKRGVLAKMMSAETSKRTFTDLSANDRDLLFALADLRNWQDLHENEVEISPDHLNLSHDAVSSLSTKAAEALGLPADVHFTLKTDVTGVLGKPNFRLSCEWLHHGRTETPKRVGAILETSDGPRRIPLWMKRALDLADSFDPTAPMEEHWNSLAEFRQALEPEDNVSATLPENREMAGLSMTAFLRGLEVRTANRFSISPDRTLGQFEVVPYSSKSIENAGRLEDEISESDAELEDEALAVFQHRLRSRGARSAYQLGNNSYLVIDRSSAPILEEMVRVQGAGREERQAFVKNPRAFIAEAVSRHLDDEGSLKGLDKAEQEELVESIAVPALIESREYSERVTGVTIYEKPPADFEGSGTAWLPEVFELAVVERIRDMPIEDLRNLHEHMQQVANSGQPGVVEIGDQQVEVTEARIAAITGEIEGRQAAEEDSSVSLSNDAETPEGPIILETLDNYDTLSWHKQFSPRHPKTPVVLPDSITTPLRTHQLGSFDWATAAWKSGLPGILNADEQGLGKTLQTIAFLNWLQGEMRNPEAEQKGPVLIVAPTSLLRNWEEEVDRHVAPRKFGTLIRLYGSSLSGHKKHGARGTETNSGLPLLNMDWLEDAFEDGRAHRYWILTTYTTMANYQHSLGKIPFSVLVMDEIQNIKNRYTIASRSAEAMNADFRIGLTGTPIENSTMDLWTIMDRLAPGCLDAGSTFKERYSSPDPDNMNELHQRVFGQQGEYPPLGLRRLKEQVAKDLPSKTRLLQPQLMPQIQATAYEGAQKKLAVGGPGAALKMLHHIRSVSVHPGTSEIVEPEEFVAMSARLNATMEILKRVRNSGERALVFIEHREMQFRFAELVKYFFAIDKVDIINGDTPIPKRQEIVNRFQDNLNTDGEFDLLILGPKAAGTGLTLTAATNVIHLSRWWNPAVEEQCNDRVHRIGQTKPVTVHVPMAIHPDYGVQSFDCLLQSLMQRKRELASQALWPMGDTKNDLSGLQAEMIASKRQRSNNILTDTMIEQFQRDGLPSTEPDQFGAYRMS